MTKHILLNISTLLFVCILQLGCATPVPTDPNLARIDNKYLPTPNLTVKIPGLSSCTTMPDSTIHLNSNEPLNIIAHGCYSSAARFRALAQVFAFHGQQTICFNYNDRDSLNKSASELNHALESLSSIMKNQHITVIGHSQGGLIARRALIKEREDRLQEEDLRLRLVTISSPFSGIAAANHCASTTARIVSLGLVVPVCKIISGDKWYEITRPSPFIQQPGELIDQVESHIKVVTNETGTCRQADENGVCIEDDYVFSLNEQYFDHVDSSAQVDNIEIAAGHAEIVGDYRTPPEKLISLMQVKGIMSHTPPSRRKNLSVLLSRLYDK